MRYALKILNTSILGLSLSATVCTNLVNAKTTSTSTSLTETVSAKQTPVEKSNNDSPINATIYATSNYVFRGISQTSNHPAAQFNIIYKLPFAGFYANLWASNVDFVNKQGERAWWIWAPAIGIANKINQDWSYDFSYVDYTYPDVANINYREWIGILRYKYLSGTIGYSNSIFGSGGGTYYGLALNLPIPKQFFALNDLNLLASAGYYDLEPSLGHSYADYMAGFSKVLRNNLTLIVKWKDTNGAFNYPPYDGSFIYGTLSMLLD